MEKVKSGVKVDAFAGKKTLVAGSAGFIDSWLCDILVDFGTEVTTVDNSSTGQLKNIEHLTSNKQFKC